MLMIVKIRSVTLKVTNKLLEKSPRIRQLYQVTYGFQWDDTLLCDLTVQGIAKFSCLSHLEILEIQPNPSSLADSLKSLGPNLEYLKLWNSFPVFQVGEIDYEQIFCPAFLSFKNLKILKAGCKSTRRGSFLWSLPNPENLTHITIEGSSKHWSCEIYPYLLTKCSSQLKELSLKDVGRSSLLSLQSPLIPRIFLKISQNLNSLHLAGDNSVSKEAWNQMFNLLGFQETLKTLQTVVPLRVPNFWNNLEKLTHLQNLCLLKDSYMGVKVHMKSVTSLPSLKFLRIDIKPQWVRGSNGCYKNLRSIKNLEQLYVTGCPPAAGSEQMVRENTLSDITNQVLESWSRNLSQSLEVLALQYTTVTDEGLGKFLKIRGPMIRGLILDQTLITDIGLKSIGKFCPNLEYFFIRRNVKPKLIACESLTALVGQCKKLRVLVCSKRIQAELFDESSFPRIISVKSFGEEIENWPIKF